MIKFQISLDETTYKTLRALSLHEYRDWRLQASFLIREALNKRGLLNEQPKLVNEGHEDEKTNA